MNKLLAVAYLTIREAIRSRLMAALAAFLFAAVFWLSVSIQGDGTLGGRIQVLIEYGLGTAFAILAVASLGISAGAVSGDIEEKTIQLIAVKPLPRWGIWLGRWLGLLALNAILLTLCALMAYGIATWHLTNPRSTPGEQADVRANLLTARERIPADPPDVEKQARAFADQMTRENAAPDMTPDEILAAARRQMRLAYQTVAPHDSRRWTFTVPPGTPPAPLMLRIQFRPGSVERTPMTGQWLIRSGSTSTPTVIPATQLPGGIHRLPLPGNLPADGQVTVTFVNGDAAVSGTTVFHPSRGVELLAGAHDFGPNLMRATFILFLRLALLAAIGLTAGAAFSTPVATFMAASFALMGILVQYAIFSGTPEANAFAHSHDHDEDAFLPAWVAHAMEPVSEATIRILAPVTQYDPLGMIADAQWISTAELVKAGFVLVLLYGGVTAGVGIWLLRRRELALPG